MIDAWRWAVSTIERGLTVREGLSIYRESGFHIATTSWNYLCGKAREAARISGGWERLEPTEILPASAFTEIDIDYERKYVAVAKVRYRSELTGELITKHVTVESDMLMTVDDWKEEIYEVAGAYPDAPAWAFIDIKAVHFHTPSWAW